MQGEIQESQTQTLNSVAKRSKTIRYATGKCSLGSFLVATTERGLCAILLGQNTTEVIDELRNRFPKEMLSFSLQELTEPLEAVRGFVEIPNQSSVEHLSLDPQGTVFQQRVWQELRQIPCGRTISYAQLAMRIGNPRSIRAVASACASNPLAVVIPCHRALGSDGKLTGYRWGLERKRNLLRMEQHNG
jgi:AraC family transcriptional regulator, regulatory protein of adaptative response / methylated-DNA-[protein]-cysteine methyltransferase